MGFTPMHRYLVEAARARPGGRAIVGERELTYGQLELLSRQLGAAFRAHGLERGGRVALCLPKSAEAVAAIYGALRAGGAYVPIDPLQPAPRARSILADCEPTVLVTDEKRLRALEGEGLPASLALVVVVGEPPAARAPGPSPTILPLSRCLDGEPPPQMDPGAGEEDLAIILYTSGSTGTPKGVQIAHRNLDAFIGWALAEFAFGPEDVFANHAGLHFDLSTLDLYAAAAAGGAVWIVPEADMRNPAALAAGIERHRVTVWYSVPSILSLMVGQGALDERSGARLRYVFFAGEVFPIKHLRALRQVLPRAELHNLYGPTETNVCTSFRVGGVDPARTSPVPIGAPASGARAWIVPDGDDPAVGELMIEGRCVTPGYWRRSGYPNEGNHRRRVHATGDLVSVEDGQLVYRGRKDRMVKVNGFRVEVGEVEAVLSRHPSIAEAAVVPAIDGSSVTRLVAFCAPAVPGAALSLLDVKRHCSTFLPSYMIPHALTCLAALPKNANGKTDVPRLAAMLEERASAAGPGGSR